MENKRIQWVDTARGIALVLIVLGHAPRENMADAFVSVLALKRFLYAFHLSIFFFLSGYVFAKHAPETPAAFLRKKSRSLLLPWAAFTAVLYLIRYAAEFLPGIGGYLSRSSYALVGIGEYTMDALDGLNPYAVHTWYLLALFLIQIFYYFFVRLFDKAGLSARIPTVCMVLISGAFYLIPIKFHPYIIYFAAWYLIYYVEGVLFGKACGERSFTARRGWISLIAGIGISGLYTWMDVVYNHMEMPLPGGVVFLITALQYSLGCSFMIYGVICLSASLKGKVQRWLAWAGRNSFPIFLLHQPFACAFVGIVLSSVLPFHLAVSYGIMLVCCITSFVLPCLFVWIAEKLKLGPFLKAVFQIQMTPLPLERREKVNK